MRPLASSVWSPDRSSPAGQRPATEPGRRSGGRTRRRRWTSRTTIAASPARPAFPPRARPRDRSSDRGSTSWSGRTRSTARRRQTTTAGRSIPGWLRRLCAAPGRHRRRSARRPRAQFHPTACSGGSRSASKDAFPPGSRVARRKNRCLQPASLRPLRPAERGSRSC